MWGRLDGAGWLVHLLLSPPHVARLATRLRTAGENPVEVLRTELTDIAGAEPPAELADRIDGELRRATDGDTPLPASLPLTSMWVATGLQRLIAAQELPCVAEQSRRDEEDGAALTTETKNFLDAYDRHPLSNPQTADTADPAAVENLLRACRISAETFATERGTPMLTRTIVQSAAVVSNAAEAATTRWKPLRPLFGTLGRALRLTHQLLRSDRVARDPLTTGVVLVAGGALAATSSLTWIGAVGLVSLLAGVVVLAAGVPTQKLKFAIGALSVTAIAVFVAAAAIPFVRGPLFDWLDDDVIPYLRDHAWAWALVAAVLLLPPAWTVYDLVRSLRRRSEGEQPAAEGGDPPSA
jgi:hypothetical protein